MAQVTLTRKYRFSASHRLHTPQLDEARNFEVYGKCNNPYGHGHDYVLEVAIRGVPDAASGRVVPLRQLDQFVENVVLKAVRHRNLNADLAEFGSLVPTTENLAVVLMQRLAAAWPLHFVATGAGSGVALEMVRIHETKRNIFEMRVSPAF